MILEDAPENNPNYIIDNINSAGINRKYKMDCERHKIIAESKGLTKDEIYQKARWIKCTCEPRRIWCDYCRGSAVCLRCRKRDGQPRNKNYIYCTWCGGNGKCEECNEIGEMIKS